MGLDLKICFCGSVCASPAGDVCWDGELQKDLRKRYSEWDGDLSGNNLTLLKVSHHPKEMQSSAV